MAERMNQFFLWGAGQKKRTPPVAMGGKAQRVPHGIRSTAAAGARALLRALVGAVRVVGERDAEHAERNDDQCENTDIGRAHEDLPFIKSDERSMLASRLVPGLERDQARMKRQTDVPGRLLLGRVCAFRLRVFRA